MGNLIGQIINYFYSKDELVYSSKLCIKLPIAQNDVYEEDNNNNNNKNDNNNNNNNKIYDV